MKDSLEEAIERLFRHYPKSSGYRKAALIGKEWQQERSYSEEEVKNILFEWSVYKVNTAFSDGEIMDYEQWFEQFKKK